MSDMAISVKNISKKYNLYNTPQDRMREALHPFRKKFHHDFWALKDVSFDVLKGKSVGIIGKNGSGKSTLLKILTGVLTPSSGSIEINGRLAALLELGAGFNPELTGIENVYFNGTLMGISREEMENRLNDILAFADIGEFVYQPVKTYSSGMFVRLAFAVAVCVEPDILVIDEALAVGDMAFQQKCLDRMAALRERGVTILLVTHDIMLTRNYCEYVVYLRNGQVVMVVDAETAGEAYIKDTKNELQKMITAAGNSATVTVRARFGSSDGVITAVELNNPESGIPVFMDNDKLKICIQGRINKNILFPRVYMQIRDVRGYIIYGTFTMPDEIQRLEKADHFEVSACLSMTVMLAPGEYSITAAINNAPGDSTQEILDKQVGVASFTVLARPGSRLFHGAVNLKSLWEKKTSGESAAG